MNLSNLSEKNSYKEGPASLLGDNYSELGSETRKRLRKMIPLSGEEIKTSMEEGHCFVTRKINGEMAVLVYVDGECVLINSGNKVRIGLPVLEETKKILNAASVKQIVLGCELYCDIDGQERVSYIQNALKEKPQNLKLAIFDIYEIDDQKYSEPYSTAHEKISELFMSGNQIQPVWMKKAESRTEVETIFQDLILKEKAEGIVVHSSTNLIYKIKPRHTLDCAIMGFTLSEDQMIRNLLYGLRTEKNTYQIIGHCGNGLEDETRKELTEELSKNIIDSDFLHTDGKRLAFQYVTPLKVAEISANDINNESLKGIIPNPILRLHNNKFEMSRMVAGISLIHPVFEKLRDDKKADSDDVRISQIETHLPSADEPVKGSLSGSPSEQLLREVYVKESKGKKAIRKFMTYKTNKGDVENFLEYLFFYTDFSDARKEPLKTEIRISSSKKQIEEIFNQYKEKNVKKGWELVT